MKKKTYPPNKLIERVFRITRKHNSIDLSGSVATINGETSEKNFETETFLVRFSMGSQQNKRQYSIFMSPSEVIPDEEIKHLYQLLGIQISGDGSQFHIHHFKEDFTLTFDLHNSIAIDNLGVKKGVIQFKNKQFNRRTVQLPYRKKKKPTSS